MGGRLARKGERGGKKEQANEEHAHLNNERRKAVKTLDEAGNGKVLRQRGGKRQGRRLCPVAKVS